MKNASSERRRSGSIPRRSTRLLFLEVTEGTFSCHDHSDSMLIARSDQLLIFDCTSGLNNCRDAFFCNCFYIIDVGQESVGGHYAAFEIVAELVGFLDTGFDCADSVLLSRPDRQRRVVLPEHDSVRSNLACCPPGMQQSMVLGF